MSPRERAGTRAVCGRGSSGSEKSHTRINLVADSGGRNFVRTLRTPTTYPPSVNPVRSGGPRHSRNVLRHQLASVRR